MPSCSATNTSTERKDSSHSAHRAVGLVWSIPRQDSFSSCQAGHVPLSWQTRRFPSSPPCLTMVSRQCALLELCLCLLGASSGRVNKPGRHPSPSVHVLCGGARAAELWSKPWYWGKDVEVEPTLEVSASPLLPFLLWVLGLVMACLCWNNWGLAMPNPSPLAWGREAEMRWQVRAPGCKELSAASGLRNKNRLWVSAAALEAGVWGERGRRSQFLHCS